MIIEIDFTPGWCNGNMHFALEVNQQRLVSWHADLPSDRQKISCESNTTLSDALHLRLIAEGKDLLRDTKIVDGTMVEDKCIDIERFTVGGIDITGTLFLHDFVTTGHGTVTKTKYFGFNGHMDLDITPNLFVWLQACEQKHTRT
jgi:hypothetical protein